MNMMNTHDFAQGTIGSLKPESLDWAQDLENHAKLAKTYFYVTAEQTKLMEQQRLLNLAGDEKADTDGSAAITVELMDLDDHLLQIKTEMGEIERRALTYVPTDGPEAQSMLRFVASVLEFGHKVDPDYLADVMTVCADVIQSWETSVKEIEFSMHG